MRLRTGFTLLALVCLLAAGGAYAQTPPSPTAAATPNPPDEGDDAVLPVPPETVITPENAANLTLYAFFPRVDVSQAVWSPDGSRLAMAAGTEVTLYDTRDLDLRPPLNFAHGGTVLDMAFSPAGDRLAVSAANGGLTVWRHITDEDALRVQTGPETRRPYALAYHPDGIQIAYLDWQDGLLRLWNTATEAETVFDAPISPYTGIAFSPDGRVLAASTRSGDSLLYYLESGETTPLFPDPQPHVAAPDPVEPPVRHPVAFSPDGRWLAAGRRAPLLSRWDMTTLTTAPSTAMVEGGIIHAVTFSPDSRLLALAFQHPQAGEAMIFLFDTATHLPQSYLEHYGVEAVAFSPDQTRMASVGSGEVRLWALPASLPARREAARYADVNVVAYCDALGGVTVAPRAGQSVGIVWSWYAAAPEMLAQHLESAVYELKRDDIPVSGWRYITRVQNSPVNENLPTVYYYINIGNLRPGDHRIDYRLTWTRPISDGFDSFGPNTANPENSGTCTFAVGE